MALPKNHKSMSFIKDNTANRNSSKMSKDFESRVKTLKAQSKKLNKSVAGTQKTAQKKLGGK